MSTEDIDSDPLKEKPGVRDAFPNEEGQEGVSAQDDSAAESPEEISRQLKEMVQIAEVAVNVAEDMVRKVEERAENPDVDPEEIAAARTQTANALERAQLAYSKAQQQADHGDEAPKKKDLSEEELQKLVSDIIDRQELKAKLKEQEERKAEEAERTKERLAREAVENQKKKQELAEEARKREEAQAAKEERKRQEKEAEKMEQERRRELNKTPEGRAQLGKEAKEKRIAINNTKRQALEIVMEGLKPRYGKMKGSLTTMFMLPHLNPLRIEQRGKEDEPKLICNFGMLKKTENGHRTHRFRSVIRSGPKGIKFEVDHQAWRSWLDGRAEVGLTRYDWGTDLHGPKPNPRENLTAKEAIEDMQKRLDQVEAEHKSMVLGRLVKAGVMAGALIAGAIYSQQGKAETFEDPALDDDESSLIVVNEDAVSKLPGYMLYDPASPEIEEQAEEPGL